MPTNAINDTGVKYLYDKLHGEIEPIAEAVSDSEVTIEGNPLSFNTLSSQNAKSTILSLEPIQDLHGYDKPWVGGAGKNKLPLTVASIKASNTNGTWSGNAYTYNNVVWTILTDNNNNVVGINSNGTANENSALYLFGKIDTDTNYILNGCPSGGSTSTYRQIIYPDHHDYDHVYFDTGSGTSSFTKSDASKDFECRCVIYSGVNVQNKVWYPMIRLSTETDATFAPYTNYASISGRTEVNLDGCGKNLLPNVTEQGSINAESGSELVSDSRIRTPYIYLSAGTYTLSNGESLQEVIDTYDKYKNYIHIPTLTSWADSPRTFTCQEGYYRFLFRKSNNATLTPSELLTPQLEKNNQATGYSPYTESTDLTIQFGETVYGCHHDVENGVLVVDRGIVDLGSQDLTWSSNQIQGGTYRMRTADISSLIKPCNVSQIANIKCDCYESISANDTYRGNIGVGIDNISYINIYDERYNQSDSPSAFKTAMSGHQLCYELAEPITIQLTPHQISLLEGVNNISTTADGIKLTYRDGKVATLADLTSAVDELDGKIEDSKILTDTATGDKYILVVTNGVLSVEQISN